MEAQVDTDMEEIMSIEYHETVLKAYTRARDKLMMEVFYDNMKLQVQDKKYNGNDRYILKMRELATANAKMRKQQITSEYYWVSVSPKPEISLDQLIIKVDKYVGRKMVSGSMYCYEWNSAGNPHTHMLIHNLENSDKDFRKNTTNTFKTLVGNLKCIDIRRVPEDWVEDKKLYIKGDKWDDNKQELIELDKEYRMKYDLQPYYTTGTLSEPDPLLDEGSSVVDI